MPRLQLNLLGGFEARLATGQSLDIVARKSRALLAYLALPTGRAHSRDALVGLLWGDRGEEQARNSLRQAITELGRAFVSIEPSPLLKNRDTLALDSTVVEVDALLFEGLVASDRTDDLRRAVALYAGDFLEGLGIRDPSFEEWLLAERQRLRLLVIAALGKLLRLETGGDAGAVAQRLLALDPLQEEVHRAIMRLHAEAGEVGLAERQYESCRDILKRELDILPSAETENLHRRIRSGREEHPMGDSSPTMAPAVPVGDPGAAAAIDPSKPTIAILPFRNLGEDPAQRYFSDGITEDIITELGRFHLVTVIARDSSFNLRDQPLDVTEIGRRLGVQYLVDGSVRRAGDRVLISARLIEADTGSQLWSERYDRRFTDIFAVQDEVVQAIAGVLPGRILAAGGRSARRKRPENLAAYDCLLRGLELHLTFDHADSAMARAMFEKAIALDPAMAPAHTWLAVLQLRDWWSRRSPTALDHAFALARQGVALDGNDATCHAVLGNVYLERRRLDEAAAHLERAVALNPNGPAEAVSMGSLLAYLGRAAEGVTWIDRAFRLNPFAPPWYHSAHGMVLYAARQYTGAISAFGRIVAKRDHAWEIIYLAASHGQLGHRDESRALIEAYHATGPALPMLQFAANEPYRNAADLEHLLDGLRKAGAT